MCLVEGMMFHHVGRTYGQFLNPSGSHSKRVDSFVYNIEFAQLPLDVCAMRFNCQCDEELCK